MLISKKFLFFSVCIGLSLFAYCGGKRKGTSPEGKINWFTDFHQGLKTAEKEKKPILVDFYTNWCKWCKVLDESTYAHSEVAKFLGGLVCIKVNAEKDTLIAKSQRVSGYPSILFLKSNGEEIDRIVGYLPPKEFVREAKRILKGKDVFAHLLEREKKNPEEIDLLYKLGEKFVDRGMYKEANERFKKIVKLDGENKSGKSDDALFGIGRGYLAEKEYDKAINEFKTLVSTYPNADLVTDAQLFIGYCLERKGEKDKAIATYKRFVSDHPESKEANWAKKRIEKLASEEKR